MLQVGSFESQFAWLDDELLEHCRQKQDQQDVQTEIDADPVTSVLKARAINIECKQSAGACR